MGLTTVVPRLSCHVSVFVVNVSNMFDYLACFLTLLVMYILCTSCIVACTLVLWANTEMLAPSSQPTIAHLLALVYCTRNDWSLISMTNWILSVPWHCWLVLSGLHNTIPKMTYNVMSRMLGLCHLLSIQILLLTWLTIQAWLNEKLSPELLPHHSEIVDCMMEQLSVMQQNINRARKADLKVSIHKMEVIVKWALFCLECYHNKALISAHCADNPVLEIALGVG